MGVLANAIIYFVQVVNFLILARVIMSWVIKDFSNPIVQFIFQVTEPILMPFRKLLERIGLGGTIDFSPIVAMLAIQFIANALLRAL
ncbi:YggT family protein [Helicovermis profundi]|uniref:YggT family protein n=1 Tax=Helicovermis profundi TaxID=3065157 RepID=A0AAU9E4F6_9FIRM|nr:YggT family protein [Clostridia bacterium S502]